jgi:hypothetical protein
VHTFTLQDFTTIRGAVTVVIQAETGWLDLSPFQDLFYWVDCREVSASGVTPSLTLETAPAKDDSLFQQIATATVLAASSTPTVVKASMTLAITPVARWVRWKLTANTGPWDATFRILLAANSPGL